MTGRTIVWASSLILFILLALSQAACGNQTATRDSDNANSDEAALEATVTKNVKPAPDAEVAVMEMTDPGYGRIVIELYPNIAPKMVERYKQLIKEGFYNGTTFHRINPELGIIQGGDPLSKDDNPANDGTGDSPYPNVPGEMSDIPFDRGIVGAARKGARPSFGGQPGLTEKEARDTANCQFYITLKKVPEFDKKYTVFGRVIDGINNADIIAGAPVDNGSERPSPSIIIKSVTLQPRTNFVK
ncbi:MAG TPA: peptidylprolyl isomerase [Pyrinomonadaceae bacterium]|jgi:cyclophilin family peptidyl-prolyl cis-trans isomerase|nr:peptidylprolyl isomerase [Pyrinomonadaceae bacterium]